MDFPRASGILLHPTSLPGKYGIGDLGSEAFVFADFLKECGQRYWQILPLGPTGYGNSPYSCLSAFAGNPLLISPEKLLNENLLKPSDLIDIPVFKPDSVDFEVVTVYKNKVLWKSWEYFNQSAEVGLQNKFQTFCDDNAWWLDDYSLFMALKGANNSTSWNEWSDDIKWRKPEILEIKRIQLKQSIGYYKYQQFLFNKQWMELKKYCQERDIFFIGDMPIFVNIDSDTVWAQPDLFQIDKNGFPAFVAGVPPDYFSETGQLWGNPIYRWEVMEQQFFSWWINRFKATFELVDYLRIDHFRGFESYWEIPGMEVTAVKGHWVKAPGLKLFKTVETTLGTLPIIAEDLGAITPEVKQLRDSLGFPGMRVLQFAFDEDKANEHKPFNFVKNCVVYTGTHDNNTSVGWFLDVDKNTTMSDEQKIKEKQFLLKYLGTDGKEVNWDLVRLALASVADTAIIPLQDVLGLGSEARMNIPGTTTGNWRWRFIQEELTDKIKTRLKEMTRVYGR